MKEPPSSSFPETRWSAFLQLREPGSRRQRAVEEWCQSYWQPLYAFARQLGRSQHDAEDLTQGFVARLLGEKHLAALAPEKGRMRTFLKTSFKNYIIDETRRELRGKRGGGQVVSLDVESAESQYLRLASASVSPEVMFDRHWGRTIVDQALAVLRRKFRDRGRAETLAEIEVYLGPDDAAPPYAAVAARLGQTENAVAAAVHRMRQEFQEILRGEIADTLAPGENADEELRYLMQIT